MDFYMESNISRTTSPSSCPQKQFFLRIHGWFHHLDWNTQMSSKVLESRHLWCSPLFLFSTVHRSSEVETCIVLERIASEDGLTEAWNEPWEADLRGEEWNWNGFSSAGIHLHKNPFLCSLGKAWLSASRYKLHSVEQRMDVAKVRHKVCPLVKNGFPTMWSMCVLARQSSSSPSKKKTIQKQQNL